MIRTIYLLGLAPIALLTSSCALFRKPEPVLVTKYVNVPTPVAVSCLKPDQKPTQPKRLVDDNPYPPASLTRIVGHLRAKLKEWQDDYGPTADDLLTICSKVPSP